MQGKLGPRLAKVFVAGILVLLVLAEVLIYYPPVAPHLNVSVVMTDEDGTLVANITASSSYTANLRETFYYTNRPIMPLDIYLYFDTAYPLSFSDLTDWFGISQHLDALGTLRGIPVDVRVLDASALATFFSQPPTSSDVLIAASGVLPDTVFTKSTDLVAPWIEAGGIMVWSGDKIGTYSGVPGVPLAYPSPANPGDNGTRQFVNLSLFGDPNSTYALNSLDSVDLGLNYSQGIHFDGLNVSGVETEGGVTLGNLDSGFTNLASLPLGNGTLIYFGGPTISAQTISGYIFNLLQTGAYGFAFTPFDTLAFQVSSSHGFTDSVRMSLPALPTGYSSGQIRACAFGFQTDYDGEFGTTTCIST